VRVLATPADGIGDITVTVARVAPGRMNAHRHGPGGEVMYISGGLGRLWIEGLPLALSAGTAAVAPAGILHNAENIGTGPLTVVGVFCPAAVPGSYAEEPPRFIPTGALDSVEHLGRRTAGTRAQRRRATEATIEALVDDPVLSPNIRLRAIRIREDARFARRVPRATLAWVVLRGRAEVTTGSEVVLVGRHGLIAAAPGETVTLVARGGGLTLLEFEAAPRQG
jgi:quercetin dioxygenase-like cupin family protein